MPSKIDSPPEVRAFIYQQLSDIQNWVPDGSAITVSVAPSKEEAKFTHAKIEIDTPNGPISSYAQNEDQYDAIVAAKQELQKQLELWGDADFEEDFLEVDRADLIDAIIDGRYLH